MFGTYKGLFSSEEGTTADEETPLRRSRRTGKRKKQRYIYSEDESSEEEPKVPKVIPASAPVPTCMFMNTGASGEAGIHANKDVFKTLPRPKVQPPIQVVEDERIEFTIEINESSDNSSSDTDDSERDKRRIPVLPDDEDSDEPPKEDKIDTSGPDIKVKDDPVFLSDDEVTLSTALNSLEEKSPTNERESSSANDTGKDESAGSQKESLQRNEQGNDLKPTAAASQNGCPVNDDAKSQVSKDSGNNRDNSGEGDVTLSGDSKDPTQTSNLSEINDNTNNLSDKKSGHSALNSGEQSGSESGAGQNEQGKENKKPGTQTQKQDDVGSEADSEKTEDFEPEAEHPLITEIKEKMNEYCSQKVEFDKTLELSGNLSIRADNEKPISGSVSQSIASNNREPGQLSSATSNAIKTCHVELSASHKGTTSLSRNVRELTEDQSDAKMFLFLFELHGNLSSFMTKSVLFSYFSVENPVPTVCVPQELSNLVQQLCKDKLKYNVELLIQGELNATVDGTLVSTICNFSFEPEEDDF